MTISITITGESWEEIDDQMRDRLPRKLDGWEAAKLPVFKCQNCGESCPPEGRMVADGNDFFCDKKCWKEYRQEAAKVPNSNDLPVQKENIPDRPSKSSQHYHSELRRQIRDYMDVGMKSDDIQKLLISEWDLHIPIRSVRSRMGWITQEKKQIARECSETYLEKPLGLHQSPKEAKSQAKAFIPSCLTESAEGGYNEAL